MQKNKLKDMQRGLRESTSFGSSGSWARESRSTVKQALRQYNTTPETDYPVCEECECEWNGVAPRHQHTFTMIDDERAETKMVNADFKASMEAGWASRERKSMISIKGFERWMLAQDIPFEDRLQWGLQRLPNTRPAQRHARRRMRNDSDRTTTARTGSGWYNMTEDERDVVRFERACEWGRVALMMKWVCRNDLQRQLARRCAAIYGKRMGDIHNILTPGYCRYFLCESENDIEEFLTGVRWDDYGWRRYDNYCRTFLGELEDMLNEHGVAF